MLVRFKGLKRIYTTEDGYVALLSVLTLSAIGLAIVTTSLMYGTDAILQGTLVQQAVRARALAEACTEEGLQVTKDLVSCQNASGGLTFADHSCEYEITGEGTASCVVSARGLVGPVVRKLRAEVVVTETGLQLSSWYETGD